MYNQLNIICLLKKRSCNALLNYPNQQYKELDPGFKWPLPKKKKKCLGHCNSILWTTHTSVLGEKHRWIRDKDNHRWPDQASHFWSPSCHLTWSLHQSFSSSCCCQDGTSGCPGHSIHTERTPGILSTRMLFVKHRFLMLAVMFTATWPCDCLLLLSPAASSIYLQIHNWSLDH